MRKAGYFAADFDEILLDLFARYWSGKLIKQTCEDLNDKPQLSSVDGAVSDADWDVGYTVLLDTNLNTRYVLDFGEPEPWKTQSQNVLRLHQTKPQKLRYFPVEKDAYILPEPFIVASKYTDGNVYYNTNWYRKLFCEILNLEKQRGLDVDIDVETKEEEIKEDENTRLKQTLIEQIAQNEELKRQMARKENEWQTFIQNNEIEIEKIKTNLKLTRRLVDCLGDKRRKKEPKVDEEDNHPIVSSRAKGNKQCAWEETEGDKKRLGKEWKPTCADHTVFRRGGYCDVHTIEQKQRNTNNSRAKKKKTRLSNLLSLNTIV